MQKIEVIVTDKELETSGSFRITTGSVNDAHIAFFFEPGFGWDELDVTAVFTRADQRAYKANIKAGVYYPIPASVLTRPGTVYVSVIGCKNGDTLITSLPTPLVVERDAMNLLYSDIYPVDDNGNYDGSAYAEYVEAVNAAANRAEIAARKAEQIGIGWYTKAECDERYAKRISINTGADGHFDVSMLAPGSTPTLTVNAAPIVGVEGSFTSPAPLKCIETVKVRVVGKETTFEHTYSGFKLRRLSDDVFDTLTLNHEGVVKTSKVYSIKVDDTYGEWCNYGNYRVSIMDFPAIDLSRSKEIITNVGNCVVCANAQFISLNLPHNLTASQLASIEIWYPMADEVETVINSSGICTIPDNAKELIVFNTINGIESEATFKVVSELNLANYINEMVARVSEQLAEVDAMREELEATKQEAQAKIISTITINDTDWEIVVNDNNVTSTVQVNEPGLIPVSLMIYDKDTNTYTSTEFSYTPNENGCVITYKLTDAAIPVTALLNYNK